MVSDVEVLPFWQDGSKAVSGHVTAVLNLLLKMQREARGDVISQIRNRKISEENKRNNLRNTVSSCLVEIVSKRTGMEGWKICRHRKDDNK